MQLAICFGHADRTQLRTPKTSDPKYGRILALLRSNEFVAQFGSGSDRAIVLFAVPPDVFLVAVLHRS